MAFSNASVPARRNLAALAIVAALVPVLGFVTVAPARAAWPERPIRMVVPFAPAGASDLIARVISIPLGQALGQTIIIENMAGANGTLGINNVAKAEPDGYTLLVTSSVFVVNPSLSKSATYDPNKDFAPIVDLGGSPNVIVTRPDSGIADIKALLTRAKAQPDYFNYASSGVGSITQLSIELMQLRTGARMVHVPYSGAGPAVQAALSGTTHLAGINISAVMPHIKAGTLKALAQTGKERWFELPDVPTLEDAGVPNSASETFQILLAPAGTPRDIVDKIAQAVIEILNRPDIKERLAGTGFAVAARGPDALRRRIADEVAMWRDVIVQSKLKVQ